MSDIVLKELRKTALTTREEYLLDRLESAKAERDALRAAVKTLEKDNARIHRAGAENRTIVRLVREYVKLSADEAQAQIRAILARHGVKGGGE